jgi:hypothetical protein
MWKGLPLSEASFTIRVIYHDECQDKSQTLKLKLRATPHSFVFNLWIAGSTKYQPTNFSLNSQTMANAQKRISRVCFYLFQQYSGANDGTGIRRDPIQPA